MSSGNPFASTRYPREDEKTSASQPTHNLNPFEACDPPPMLTANNPFAFEPRLAGVSTNTQRLRSRQLTRDHEEDRASAFGASLSPQKSSLGISPLKPIHDATQIDGVDGRVVRENRTLRSDNKAGEVKPTRKSTSSDEPDIDAHPRHSPQERRSSQASNASSAVSSRSRAAPAFQDRRSSVRRSKVSPPVVTKLEDDLWGFNVSTKVSFTHDDCFIFSLGVHCNQASEQVADVCAPKADLVKPPPLPDSYPVPRARKSGMTNGHEDRFAAPVLTKQATPDVLKGTSRQQSSEESDVDEDHVQRNTMKVACDSGLEPIEMKDSLHSRSVPVNQMSVNTDFVSKQTKTEAVMTDLTSSHIDRLEKELEECRFDIAALTSKDTMYLAKNDELKQEVVRLSDTLCSLRMALLTDNQTKYLEICK